MSEPAFDPLMALRTLLDHDVRFVLIGGFAGALRGSPVITGDVDICCAREDANLERLAEALRALGAHLRGAHRTSRSSSTPGRFAPATTSRSARRPARSTSSVPRRVRAASPT